MTTTLACTMDDRSNPLASGMHRAMWVAVPLLLASELLAVETPSAPFLEKNDFYLRSAGFNVKFANNAAGEKALRGLPAHQFVTRTVDGKVRYLYAEPKTCVCVFVGTRDNYLSYRSILAQPLPTADDVAPDYKTQASALLANDPTHEQYFDGPDEDFFREYY